MWLVVFLKIKKDKLFRRGNIENIDMADWTNQSWTALKNPQCSCSRGGSRKSGAVAATLCPHEQYWFSFFWTFSLKSKLLCITVLMGRTARNILSQLWNYTQKLLSLLLKKIVLLLTAELCLQMNKKNPHTWHKYFALDITILRLHDCVKLERDGTSWILR